MRTFILFLTMLGLMQAPVGAQPVITQPPTNQVVALGVTLTLGVTASDPLAAFQWFKDSRLIVGATNSALTVANAGMTNSGTYYVLATNTGGMVMSLPALVMVGNPSLLAWGANGSGRLGNGTTSNTNLPVSVASNVVAGAAGGAHSLFVTTDGTLWAMGYNSYGELGNGTTSNTNLPVSVASNMVAVAAGQYHSLFVTMDGTLWAMGENNDGQLGNGTTSNTNWPICVASNVVSVAAGQVHSLFVKTDGTLWGMGYNAYGELGIGMTTDTNTPICVASNVVTVAGGAFHSLFVTSDGTLWGMGYNAYGQLGNGTTNNAYFPVSVASNVLAVAAGAYHSLFVKTDGTLWGMGYNAYGQLGNGTTNDAHTPVNVANLSVANVFPADTAYHSLAIGYDYNAIVTLGNLNQLYTGSAISVTASTTPPGLTVNLTYNGSPVAPTNAGSYTVIGTITDAFYIGSATNTLIVGLPPQSFTGSSMASANGNQLTLQLTGTPNYPYILQMATNLTPPVNWQSILTNPADVNGNWSLAITNLPAFPAGFYRAAAQ